MNQKLKLSRVKLPFDFTVGGIDQSFIYLQPSTKQIKEMSKDGFTSIRNIETILRENISHDKGDENIKEVLFEELLDNYNLFDVKIELDEMMGNYKRESSETSSSGQSKMDEGKGNSPTP